MKGKEMKRLFLITTLCIIFAGCGILKPKNPICDTDQPSTLCQAVNVLQAHHVDITLDDIATTLKAGNIAALAGNVYTAQEALNFIDKLNNKLTEAETNGVTYSAFIAYVESQYIHLSPAVQAALILAQSDYDWTIPELAATPLQKYDFYLLRKHLTDERALVAPFLLSGGK